MSDDHLVSISEHRRVEAERDESRALADSLRATIAEHEKVRAAVEGWGVKIGDYQDAIWPRFGEHMLSEAAEGLWIKRGDHVGAHRERA